MKRITFLGAAALVAMTAQMSTAAEASATLDLASAYVFRGMTFNDGAVLQPGLSVANMFGVEVPFSMGVWGNLDLDDYDGAVEDGQFSEIDIWGNLGIPLPESAEVMALNALYTEYTYPSGGGDADRELGLKMAFDVPSAPYLVGYYGIDGDIDSSWYFQAGVSHEMPLAETGMDLALAADIGYSDAKDGESGFSHYDLTAALKYKILTASVVYVGQIDDDVLPDGAGAYDTEFLGKLGVVYDF